LSDAAPLEQSVSLVSASAQLLTLSLRRQFLSRQSLICLALTLVGAAIAWGWTKRDPTVKKYAEEILVPVHVAFLVPIYAICYGTAAVGGEREDRTLVYLLLTPMPRPLVYFVKYATAVALILGWTMGSLGLLAFMARPWGSEALQLFWPAIALGSVAYASLFTALGAAFRRGTIISLAYAFFLEGLIGNMPGIVKRMSVSFYMKCMIYDAGSELKIGPLLSRDLFLPIAGTTARLVLCLVAAGLFVAGLVIFTRREYRDLS
jgi:ABC-type transport system involved in multi-copper enzyme maturation permease subunit